MAKWEQRQLADCLTLRSGGTPSKARNDYWGGDIPWVSCKDMKVGRIHDAEDHLTPLGAENGTRLVPPNTILFVVRGMILARDFPVALTKRTVAFNQDLKAAEPADFIDNEFLFHWFRANTYEILGRADEAGHGTKRIQTDRLLAMPISVPPLPVQRRIAGILSAYDELIENSQRRIKILEAMARALYREWFVHFRFPGHEHHPRVASPLGEIPQGWEVCVLGDFVQFKSGFAFKSGTFTANGEHRLVTIKNVQDGSFNPDSDSRMDELPEKMPPYCVLNDGEILLSLTGNVGRVCLVYDGPFLMNQRVSKLVPVEAFDWAMTYCMFREPEMRVKLEQLSTGVAQQNLSPVLASQMEFARPTRQLRQKYAVLADPLARAIVYLYSKIQNLRRTRDLLLPRLLSGQVEVEEA